MTMAVVSERPGAAGGAAEWLDDVHTGPGTLAGRYLRTFWHPVFVARELPSARARPIRILGEDLTLYRGESGEPHLVAFHCAHRGTQLSTGWVEGDNLRCFYHGWTYGPDGRCVEQPAEPEPFCQRIKIRSYPVQEYVGLIFAYLGEGEPPPLPRYAAFERAGRLRASGYIRACNFFNAVDNDPIHVYFTHSRRMRSWRDGLPRISAEETPCGIAQISTWPDGRRSAHYRLLPNVSYRVTGGEDDEGPLDNIAWRVPVDDASHASFGVSWGPGSPDAAPRNENGAGAGGSGQTESAWDVAVKVMAGEVDIHSIPTDWRDLVNVEDHVTQVGQGVIADRSAEHLGTTDLPVILARQIWQRELRALAEGRPLTPWTLPEFP
jgi:5,5'-dehydrodivanillate O-demethylase